MSALSTTTKVLAGAGAVTTGLVLVAPPASADSGIINSAGNDCSGRWITNGHDFQLRDNAGGSDDDYCYINYGASAGAMTKRVTIPEDSSIGNWQTRNADMTGIGVDSLWFQVCEERENDPDLCSSAHGPYDTDGK